MKKLLIITYYWIPSGGAGVQRWVKFTKYLREFGWEPIIYTPENPEYPSEDYSLEQDIPDDVKVIKTTIWEPYDIYRNLFGKRGEKIPAGFISDNRQSTWKDKLSIWLRGNFLIPDPRKFWVKPSVRYLKNYLKENPVDAVVTTGPPHSMHLIGLGLKKQFPGLKWIADFRDPWTNIDFYQDLRLTKWADNIHHKKEKEVVTTADCVVTVSEENRLEFELLGSKNAITITNGFDYDDYQFDDIVLDDMFTISYIGTLIKSQNSTLLWKVLAKISREKQEFKDDLRIQLIGKFDQLILEQIQENGLIDNLITRDYVPHREAIMFQKSSQVLLLLINNIPNAKGMMTGKFYEYLAAKRPILAIGPADGELAEILEESKAGKIADFDDELAMRNIVLEYYAAYKHNILQTNSEGVEKYSRKNLTKQLVADCLNS